MVYLLRVSITIFFPSWTPSRGGEASDNLFLYNKYKHTKIIKNLKYNVNDNLHNVFALLTIRLLQIYPLKVWNAIIFPLQNPQELVAQIFHETLFYRIVTGLIFVNQSTSLSHQLTAPLRFECYSDLST